MTAESGVGRVTPYERVFGDERYATQEFPAIVEEAGERDLNLDRREEFALVGRVGAVLRDLMAEGTGREAFERYIDILFHAVHFWRSGSRIYAFEAEAVRELIETPPDLASREVRAPAPAFYIELPHRLFWTPVAESAPEPVEGMFVKVEPPPSEGPLADVGHLVVLGMRATRPGFSVVGGRARLDEIPRRSDPDWFRSDIPGADLAGLYSLKRPVEALVLLLRLLWHLDRYPDSVEASEPEPDGETRTPSTGGRTTLTYHRVRPARRSD